MTQAAPNKINLALQGGGSHGAYTWGVLDRLLQEEDIAIEGISGTSAGAMNAAVLVSGYAKGGREGARKALHTFWKRVSEANAFSPVSKTPAERFWSGWNLDSTPAYHYYDALTRMFSPYDLNPLNINPLRSILEDSIDFEKLQKMTDIHLFIAATHVESGQARVFRCHEVTIETLLASACLPHMFQAVEIDGGHYWDGGYMGNPTIWPLIYHCESEDVILVQINPIMRQEVPRSATEIVNRLNEITFNSSLIAEMRAIDFVRRLIEAGRLSTDEYKNMHVHLIYSPHELKSLNASSKMNTDWEFFRFLYDTGVAATENWIQAHKHDIGKKSTIDIREKFLHGPAREPFSAPRKPKRKRK